MPNQKGGSTKNMLTFVDADKNNFPQVRYEGQICGPDLDDLRRDVVYTVCNIRMLSLRTGSTVGEITLTPDSCTPSASRIIVKIPFDDTQLRLNCTRARGPNPTNISKELSLFTVVGDTRKRRRTTQSASRRITQSSSRRTTLSPPRFPPALTRSTGRVSILPPIRLISGPQSRRLTTVGSTRGSTRGSTSTRRSTRRSTSRRPTIDESQLR